MSRVKPSRVTAIGAGIADPSADNVSTGGSRAIAAVVWIASLAAVALGLNRLEPLARGLSTHETRIEWVNLPHWLTDPTWSAVLHQIEDIPNFDADTDIFDSNVTAYIGEQLSKSPWIERIDRVAKLADGRVRVTAHFRKPFTLVEKDGWAYMIDENGVRLPSRQPVGDIEYNRDLTICGVRTPVPDEGQLWAGEDLQDGIKLVRFLWQAEVSGCLPVRKYLRCVDVSNFDRSKNSLFCQLRILTTRPGVYIHWGRPPHEEYNIEAPAEKKLLAMCEETRVRPWFEQDRPIDVRGGEADR